MIERQQFGTTSNGKAVTAYILTNASGMRVKLLDLGAIIAEIWVPDREGKLGNAVLNFESPAGYEENEGTYLGAVVGRVANRIAGASFMLRGKTYQLGMNNGRNSLHGGMDTYSLRVWDVETEELRNRVTFKLFSGDGDQNYPGNLWIKVTYTLTDEGEVRIRYRAKSDQMTLLNLTNHSYFNLSGKGWESTILDHMLWINSSRMTPVDAELIPTGEYREVAGTPMDFTVPKTVGRDIEADDEQLKFAGGYDHNWMLEKGESQLIFYHPKTGRRMTMVTDLPGVQVYSGNFLEKKRAGMCFETQIPPDAVHHDNFPNCILMPDQEVESTTIYRFDVAEDGFEDNTER